jgi:hypothetical protein
MIDIDQYFSNGYASLKLSEVCTDMDTFNATADKVMSIPINNQTYSYVLSVFGKHNDPEWPFKISADQVDTFKAKLQEQKLWATQQWFESSGIGEKEFFRDLVCSFIRQYYPEIKEDFSNLFCQDSFTLYKKGDFSDKHRDGQNPGRLCVVLIYLTEEKYYNDAGGLLTVSGDNEEDSNALVIKPIRGNIAIMDFTRHNPFHGVDSVTEDFNRYCYITFLWNTDKMPNNIRPKGYK